MSVDELIVYYSKDKKFEGFQAWKSNPQGVCTGKKFQRVEDVANYAHSLGPDVELYLHLDWDHYQQFQQQYQLITGGD